MDRFPEILNSRRSSRHTLTPHNTLPGMLRTRSFLALGWSLLLVAMALHNGASLRLRDLRAREGGEELWRRLQAALPLPAGLALALAAVAAVLALAVLWRLLGRRERPRWLPFGILAMGLAISALRVDWASPHLPLQWSLVLLPLAAAIAVVATLLGTPRRQSLATLGGALASFVLLWSLQPPADTVERLKARAAGARLRLAEVETAASDLRREPGSHELFAPPSPELLRLDERLEEMVLLDAREADPNEGLLAKVPGTHRLEGFRGVKGRQFDLSGEPIHIDGYPEGALFRTEPPLGLPTADVEAIRIRMRVSAGSAFSLYWNEGDRFDRLVGMRIPLAEDRDFYTYELSQPLGGISTTYGIETVDHLYLAPSDRDADVEIDFIEIRSALNAGTSNLPLVRSYENVAGEMRSVLSVRHGTSFELEVPIPANAPRLEFGSVAARGSATAQLEISLSSGESSETLFRGTVGTERAWVDHEIDLHRFAGRSALLRVDTRSVGAGSIHLSNPVIVGAPEMGPNVVIYLVDCLRGDHDGLDRYEESLTPQMDRFGGEGARFRSAYSNGCTTKLSVPSLMSSNPISATGVRHADGMGVLAESFVTLPEALRAAGYATGAVTSNSNLGSYSGTHQGFSWLIDQYISGGVVEAHAMHHPDMDGRDIVRLSLDWLRARGDRPFFLYVHTLDSHGPYDPPERYREHFQAVQDGTPVERNTRRRDPEWVENPTREGRRALYDGTVQYSDELFQSFLDGLEQLGHLDDTLIILTSDHGEYFGEHAMWTHGPPPFVQGTHIPLMLRWPGRIPAGGEFDENVQLMDVMPTILEAAGLQSVSPLLQGDSLLPLIDGEAKAAFAERAVFVEGIFRSSVHVGALHYMGNSDRLFHLEEDPGEFQPLNRWNLSFGAKQVLKTLVDDYQRSYTALYGAMNQAGGGSVNVSPQTLEQLRALGYID